MPDNPLYTKKGYIFDRRRGHNIIWPAMPDTKGVVEPAVKKLSEKEVKRLQRDYLHYKRKQSSLAAKKGVTKEDKKSRKKIFTGGYKAARWLMKTGDVETTAPFRALGGDKKAARAVLSKDFLVISPDVAYSIYGKQEGVAALDPSRWLREDVEKANPDVAMEVRHGKDWRKQLNDYLRFGPTDPTTGRQVMQYDALVNDGLTFGFIRPEDDAKVRETARLRDVDLAEIEFVQKRFGVAPTAAQVAEGKKLFREYNEVEALKAKAKRIKSALLNKAKGQ